MTARLLIAIALGTVAMPALAQTTAMINPAIDTDGDGAYSYPEVEAVLANRTDMDFTFESEDFVMIDGSGDGMIDETELTIAMANGQWPAIEFVKPGTVAPAQEMGVINPAIDTDGDGMISYEELAAMLDLQTDRDVKFESTDFVEIDGSGDGMIDQTELSIAMANGRWPAIDLTMLMPSDAATQTEASLNASVDTDGDGLVSYPELEAAMALRTDMDFDFDSEDFVEIDGSGDGQIDMNEMSAAIAQGRWPAIEG